MQVNADGDREHFEQAIKEPKRKAAMKELRAIEKIHTWEVYKVMVKPTGDVRKYKARLVAKGFLQNGWFGLNEVFGPVARFETI